MVRSKTHRLQRMRYPCVAFKERWQETHVGLGMDFVLDAVIIFGEAVVTLVDA
jgi:hypothetical protein